MRPGVMVGTDAKVCTGCGETKPLGDFYKNKRGIAGRHAKCKPCLYQGMVKTEGHREHQAARGAVFRAVRAGRLVRSPTCEACLQPALTHGHHDDYSKPLDVRWLCPPCHDDVHRGDKHARHAPVSAASPDSADSEAVAS